MSSRDDSFRPDLMGEVRFRIPLPIVIPVVSLLVIAGAAIGFAQVLLNLPKEASTMIALVAAANILGACAYVALRPRLSQTSLVELLIVVLYPVLIGVVIANIGFGEGQSVGERPGHELAAPVGPTTSIVAEGNAFDLEKIVLAAGEQTSLEFNNQDSGTQHNVAIYKDESANDVIFDGELVTGPETMTYQFKAPPKGEYYFRCDVHTDMNGTVVAE